MRDSVGVDIDSSEPEEQEKTAWYTTTHIEMNL
jgi:hypothetical protein